MDDELWASCIDYPNYEISSKGRVYSKISGKILKHRFDYRGYPRINLKADNAARTVFIHQLVARAFIPNPNNLPTVDHVDGNKENNEIKNLRWLSFVDNTKLYYIRARRRSRLGRHKTDRNAERKN